jgi:acyl-coenzyme A synthetase/AMP-(fatty) acid ligase
MSNFYDNKPGDVFFAASDIGWVVGHSYSVYGPLLHGCTSVLYEGKPVGTPDAGSWWRCIEEHGVNTLFSAPTAFRAIRQADPEGLETKKYDLSSLRAVFAAGERADPSTLHWIENILKDYNTPAIDHWWQTGELNGNSCQLPCDDDKQLTITFRARISWCWKCTWFRPQRTTIWCMCGTSGTYKLVTLYHVLHTHTQPFFIVIVAVAWV